MSGTIVFLGPTLAAGEVPGAVAVLPPARQGDIFRAVRDLQPRVIGLVDGVFLDVPAVWHREILWALDRGVHVLGAASMGALRAAELDRYGMLGIGSVYEAYRDGVWPGFDAPFEDDDEVAVEHAPAAAGGAALSDAMVDLRATLRAGVAAGALDEAGCVALAATMKALPFAERSFAKLGREAGPEWAEWIAAHPVRQKALDARALLTAAAAIGPRPFEPAFSFTRALTWERFVAGQRMGPPSPLLARLRQDDPAAWRALRREAIGRLAALAGASAADIDTRVIYDRFRVERGLMRYEDIQAWLHYHRIDAASLARLMREEAALECLGDPADLEDSMLDLLRLSGRLSGDEAPAQ